MKKDRSTILKLAIIAIITGLSLSGCAGVEHAMLYQDQRQMEYRAIYDPLLNTTNKVEVGENMFSKSYLFYNDTNTVILSEDVYIDTFTTKIDLKANSENVLYKWKDVNVICAAADPMMGTYCLGDEGNIGSFTSYGYTFQPTRSMLQNPVQYKIIPTPPVLGADSFKYDALYQGRSGNKIKISFREFIGNTARPAFTQDVDYELDNNGEAIVGFKGLRIKVIKATNVDISYSVIHDYK